LVRSSPLATQARTPLPPVLSLVSCPSLTHIFLFLSYVWHSCGVTCGRRSMTTSRPRVPCCTRCMTPTSLWPSSTTYVMCTESLHVRWIEVAAHAKCIGIEANPQIFTPPCVFVWIVNPSYSIANVWIVIANVRMAIAHVCACRTTRRRRTRASGSCSGTWWRATTPPDNTTHSTPSHRRTHKTHKKEGGRGGAVTHSHTQAQLEGSILAYGPWERRE
jgi:hypothetical protein